MPKPSCEVINVTIDGVDQTYTITPTIFSEWSLDRLKAIIVNRKKAERVNFLKDLKEAGFEGPDLKEAVSGAFNESGKADIHEVLALLQTMDRDVMCIAVQAAVDGVDSPEDAAKLIDAYPDLYELIDKVTAAGMSDEEAAEGN